MRYPMLRLTSTTGQRQRKEKQLNAMTTPTRSAPSATGRQYRPGRRPRRARRPGKIGAGTDTPTPVARGGPLHRSALSALFFWTVHGPFSFRARPKRKWGVHPGWTSPLREQRPRGRRPAARITLPPLVAASQQVIRRHLKVVCQGNQAGHIGIMLCAFIILICPQAYPQVFRHFSLCFFSAFAELFQPPCKKFHKSS